MADIAMIVHFWRTCIIDSWSIIESYWFMLVPIFIVIVGNIVLLIWSIAPGNHNRKH